MKTARFSILVLVVSLLPANIFGQTAATARISGVVTDAQGSAVTGATVKLIDKTTKAEKTDATNSEGRYVFASVEPGVYEVTAVAQGFRTTVVPEIKAEVSKVTTVDLTLQPGGATEEVTVTATGEVQLQKDDSAVGNVLDEERITRLPIINRQVPGLLVLQPTVAPSGEVSGARGDQNTFTLDGLDVSDQVGFRGSTGTTMPIPAETIEEFRVTVANPNATFGRSAGGQVALVTKRGSNTFHGSAYEYHQNDNLNANTWSNNRLKLKKPPLVDNRFGFTTGGPIWKDKLFFFGGYEGRQNPGSASVTRIVPTQSLRDGVLRFRDAAGSVFTTDPLSKDPRGLGANPAILTYLKKLPLPNTTGGDGLNTGGFTANLPTVRKEDFGALRLDYQINRNWSADVRGSLFRSISSSGGQADIVNLKPGDLTSSRPKNFIAALTGTLRPNLVNEFRVGRAFDNFILQVISPTTIAGFNVAVNVAGATLDEAIDVDTQRARKQSLGAGTWQYTDNATWSRGAHTLQFGGTLRNISTFHFRDDKVIGSVSTPVADITSGTNVVITPAQRPPTCSMSVTTNCLQAADVSRYNALFATLLGMVNNVAYMAVRDAELKPTPIGTGLINDAKFHHWEFYGADVWKITPSLTLAYGLQYQWFTPPKDVLNRQTLLAYKDTKELIQPLDYLSRKKAAAEAGEIFNPDIAYLTLKDAGRKGVFDVNRKDFAPRIGAAWQPSISKGWLNRLFGDRKTVIRGGYSLLYDRSNTVQSVVIPMLGVGFAQTLSLAPKNAAGQPFRAGIDGNIPVPANFAVTSPVVPAKGIGITTAFGETISITDDPRIRDPYNHNFDLTIQRELPGNMLIEVGYVGRFARNLYQTVNLNSPVYTFKDKASGQTFAQAFDAVAAQLRAGVAGSAVTPQPWFENQIVPAPAGGATRFLATNALANFQNGDINVIWNAFIDGIAPRSYNNRQSLDLTIRTSNGRSNYNAAFVTLHKRTSHGLTFDFNYTLSRSLDQIGVIQNGVSQFSTSLDPDIDYGPSDFDRTHNVNANFVYDLPFGSGRRFETHGWLNRVIGGWYTSGIVQAFSGLPLTFSQGAAAYGSGLVFPVATGAIPLKKPDFGNSVHSGIKGSGGIGTSGDPATGGSGLNLFANPEQVYNSFRRINLASDGRQGRGVLRGLPFWVVDFSLGKTTKVTEHVRFSLAADFFNVLNRVNFNTPGLNLLNKTTFGVITGAQPPRRIQISGRIEF